MVLILGLNCGHDGSVALVKDGVLVGAITKERLTRVKKDTGVTVAMVDYVLDMIGAKLSDVDAVGFAGYDYNPNNEVRLYHPDNGKEITSNIYDLEFFKGAETCNVSIGGVIKRGFYIQHHLAHCASAYYTSPFKQAVCFSLDASGRNAPEASSIFAVGEDNKIFPFYCPGLMIGNEYSELTARLGLGPGLHKAGTLMGLAAYGNVKNNALSMVHNRYKHSWYERKMQPSEQAFIERMWVELSGRPPMSSFTPEESDKTEAMNIAATFQFIFEEVILEYTNRLYEETKAFNGGNICLSGGSFLNCNVNTAIKNRTPFKNVHLFPGCGDDGTAVGTALILSHMMANEPRKIFYTPADLAYLGKTYSIPKDWKTEPLDYRVVAERISKGGIVAWFQGRSEFGPRALGNRSILADPRNPNMRNLINSDVKHREWFRPFAPSVLVCYADQWFDDFDGLSPFMLHTSTVPKELRDKIPSVVHVDGTARHQTVRRDDNPRYYDLIAEFNELTGIPMLLNTSLNNNNEPLVETPEDLLNFWEKTPLVTTLVINDRMMLR